VKEHIAELNDTYPEVYEHLAAAMRCQENQELWPDKLNQKELAQKFRAFWNKKNNK
jgi:hypothetical protein